MKYFIFIVPFLIFQAATVATIWLGLHFGNNWVIAAGIFGLLFVNIKTQTKKEEK